MKHIIFLFIFFLILLLVFFILKNKNENYLKSTVEIDNHKFLVLLAVTSAEKEKGLGYRKSLPQNEGMLFLFNPPDFEKFWMKGMLFPLDIIYIRNNRIVTIFQKIENPPSKHTVLKIFSPTEPADMVLEINGGISKKYNFKIGDNVKILL